MDSFGHPDLGLSDLGVMDDWLGSSVDACDLTDFPDDAIAASLAAFSGRDEDEDLGQQHSALLADRVSTRSPGMMRASFSMNDLTAMQQQAAPLQPWNHKLVSLKPKLQPVPEGGPSNGGPLHLLPLSGAAAMGPTAVASPAMPNSAGQHHTAAAPAPHSILDHGHVNGMMHNVAALPQPAGPHNPHAGIPGLDPTLDEDFVDFGDDDALGAVGLGRPLSSTSSLTAQLQMTRVQSSDRSLAGLGGGAGLAGTGSGVYMGGGHNEVRTSLFAPAATSGLAFGTGARDIQQQAQQQPLVGLDVAQAGVGPAGLGLPSVGCDPHAAATAPPPGVKRSATGLPLRKSQSAVELASWRSFSGGDDGWDLDGLGLGGVDPTGGPMAWRLTPEERIARISRYREKKAARGGGMVGAPRPGKPPAARKPPASSVGGAAPAMAPAGSVDARPRVRSRFTRLDGFGAAAQSPEQSTSSGAATSSGGQPSATAPLAGGLSPRSLWYAQQQHGQGLPGGGARAASLPLSPSGVPPLPLPPLPAPMPGVSVIGASPAPLLQPSGSSGLPGPGICLLGTPAQQQHHLQLPGSFPPVANVVVGPTPGGVGCGGGCYMAAGQTIFTGQHVFGGGAPGGSTTSLGAMGSGPLPLAVGPLALGMQPPSGSASAHPSVSPPLHPSGSPTASDSHSHSVGGLTGGGFDAISFGNVM